MKSASGAKVDGLSFQELLQIVEVIRSSSQFSEVRLRCGDLELELRRGAAHDGAPDGQNRAAQRPHAPDATHADADQAHRQRHGHVGGGELLTDAAAAPDPAPAGGGSGTASLAPGEIAITAPMVGTFYRAPEPGAAPFIEVGQQVDPGSVVCIIEVMKLMNSIPAGCRGNVRRILADDGQAVEFGQPLIIIAVD